MHVLDEEREKKTPQCELWSYITIWKILHIPDTLQWVPRQTCWSYKLKCFGIFPGNNLSSLDESLYLLGLDCSVGSLKNILVPPPDCNSLHLSQLELHTTFKKISLILAKNWWWRKFLWSDLCNCIKKKRSVSNFYVCSNVIKTTALSSQTISEAFAVSGLTLIFCIFSA